MPETSKMETKDFVLLMMIPLILVSLVVYTDKNVTITGFATANQKDNEIIGTYSIMPSFRAKVNYDLEDYGKIKKQLDAIIECKGNDGNVEACMQQAQNANNGFQWELNCGKGTERVLYDFAEFFQDCIDSEDINCLCNKNYIELSKEDMQKYGISANYEYRITLNQIPSYNQIILESKIPELVQTINSNGFRGWVPKTFILGYNNGVPTINMFFVEGAAEKTEIETIKTFGPIKELTIYKNDNNQQKIKAIDFVKQDDNNLLYPNNKAVVDTNNKPMNANEIPFCTIKPKNIYRFCVTKKTKKDSKLMAYDAADGQVKERDATIRFAAYIPQKT